MNKIYTTQEVADRLKIKKTTVYEMIKRGELNSSKIGKQLRISEDQLNQYLNSYRQSNAPVSFSAPEFQPESSLLKRDYLLHSNGIILSGQTSPALDLLVWQVSVLPEGLPILQSHMNTYNGLYSLYFQKVHIAAASLSLTEISTLIPGIPLAAVKLYDYTLGLFVTEENPTDIHGIENLKNPKIRLANREKGSTSRIFLDTRLKKLGIPAWKIPGYEKELVSDLAAAAAVAGGQADLAIGEEATARQLSTLRFLPLQTMPMYLVMEASFVDKPIFSPLLEIIRSREFKEILHSQTGYDITQTGHIQYV